MEGHSLARPDIERFGEYALSPDGMRLAEALDGSLRGQPHESIILTELAGRSLKRKVIYGGGVGVAMLKWVDDNVLGFVDSRNPRVIEEVDVRTGKIVGSITAAGDILSFAPDPLGKRISYIFRDWANSDSASNWISMPVPDTIGVEALILPGWALSSGRFAGGGEAVTGIGISSAEQTARWTGTNTTKFDVLQLSWYGSPSRAVMARQAKAQGSWSNVSVMDVESGRTIVGPNRLAQIWRISGSRSGLLAVASPGAPKGIVPHNYYHLYIVMKDKEVRPVTCLTAKEITGIWWGGHHILWVEAVRSRRNGIAAEGELVAVNWQSNRIVREIGWPDGTLSGCQMDSSTRAAVCLAQTLTTSARLVKVNLTDGRVEPLDGLWNPVETIGTRFKEIFIRNRYGQVSDGFLALPRSDNSRRGTASGTYPLAVMLYGFDKSFAKNGQWIRAYPVDRLVRAGIAVLLLNVPEEFNWRMGDSSTVRLELLSEPLSTVLMAPMAVRASGARIGKVMVLGWSWGGLLAAHAVENSCEFVAAEIGDPPAWNEAQFALGNASWRYWSNWYFGGPPNDKYIGNYLTFDPMHSGAPPSSPILFEFVSRNLSAGQYLEEWRAAGAYVQAFGYHRSEHYLNVSAEAAMSRERNLAWAKINLLGARSVSGKTLARLGLSVPPPVRCGHAQVRYLQ